MEVIRLRVKEVDFAQGEILIRDGKGAKDRVTMLPEGVSADLREHLQRRKLVFEDDLRAGKASVYLPDALARKYPAASTSWLWQYVFVAGSYSVDPRSGVERRHHLDEKLLQRAEKSGARVRHRQAGHSAHAAPFLCHPFARWRLRHPNGAGTAWPCRREHDDDLHACAPARWAWRSQPARFAPLTRGLAAGCGARRMRLPLS